jgi:toxin ParE1/3/4
VKVVFSRTANADLAGIGDFIARHNPQRALSFVRELRASATLLGEMPQAYPLLPRHESSGIRRRPAGNYLIFYRVDEDRVMIVRIIHGARNYDRLL